MSRPASPGHQATGQTAAHVTPTPSPAPRQGYTYELPSGINNVLPKEPLQSEEDYREWADLMQGALEYALLWDIVSGVELCPDPSVDPDGAAIWKCKDSSARTLIRRTLSKTVAGAVAGQTTSSGFWTTLRQQYARRAQKKRCKLV